MTARSLGPFICRQCRVATRRATQKRHASTSPAIYDVVAVGGGPVGLALLAALSKLKILSMYVFSDLISVRIVSSDITSEDSVD